ncbi:MAG: OmpA family protein [Chlorobiales bacterium]|nr:OmpA family protein [Chlorobiales bacterium]
MEEEANSGIANSFTDLMTSLAVIFILLLCTFMNNAFEESQNTRSLILGKLQMQLKEYVAKGVRVESDPNDPLALLILVPEGLLDFAVDRFEIPPQGKDFLVGFVPKLTDTIYNTEFRNDISSVVVEGHTDSKGTDTHNLKLSQNRSMAVVSESITIMENQIVDNHHEKIDYFLRVLSASGRGKQDLIMLQGKEDSDKSRRVVFKIRVRSFEEKKVVKQLTNV